MSEPTPIDAWGVWSLEHGVWCDAVDDGYDGIRVFASESVAIEAAKNVWEDLRGCVVAHLSAPAAHRMIRVEPDGTETVVEPKPKGETS